MNKYFKKIACIMTLSVLFMACNVDENEIAVKTLDPIHDAKRISEIVNSGNEGIPFPEGSKVMKMADGNFEIHLPNKVFFLVSDVNASGTVDRRAVVEISDVSVTCSCSVGSGCSPVKVQGEYFCVMNSGCTTCTMSAAKIGSNQKIDIIGIIDYNVGVSFVSEIESNLTSPINKIISKGISEEVLSRTEVKKALLDFYTVIYDNDIPSFITDNESVPEGYSFAKVNLFGNAIMVPVKSNTFSRKLGIAEIEDSAVSCFCSIGTGCIKKSYLGAKYCDAGSCTVCTLQD